MIMLSRMADSMFWMNRYMERVDALCRGVRYFYILGFDIWEGDQLGYEPLLRCFGMNDHLEKPGFKSNTQQVLKHLVLDEKNLNSVKSLLIKARENARGSQDRITKEVWEQINGMYHHIHEDAIEEALSGEDALKLLDELEKKSLMYTGIVDSTMPRGQGWDFMHIGKFLDRALHTIDLYEAYIKPLDYDLSAKDDLLYWRRLLYALSGYEFYLKTNRGSHHNRQVMMQAVFHPDFPRSLSYSLERCQEYVRDVLSLNAHPDADRLDKKFGRIKSTVVYTDHTRLTGAELKDLLQDTREQLWAFSADFSKLFFSYT